MLCTVTNVANVPQKGRQAYMSQFLFSVTMGGNVQNLKPVQNCTGFIFYTFYLR